MPHVVVAVRFSFSIAIMYEQQVLITAAATAVAAAVAAAVASATNVGRTNVGK